MRKLILLFIIALGLFISCEKDSDDDFTHLKISETSSKEEDNRVLEELYQEIDNQSQMYDCDNVEKWNYTPIGYKPCGGGPTHYIAYSSSLDTEKFLKMVSYYTAQQETYVLKWDIVSDCLPVASPKGIECIDGKPEFTY